MNTKIRILTLLVAMMMVISLVSVSTFAADSTGSVAMASRAHTCSDADADGVCDDCGLINFESESLSSGEVLDIMHSQSSAKSAAADTHNGVSNTITTTGVDSTYKYGVHYSLKADPKDSGNQVLHVSCNAVSGGGANIPSAILLTPTVVDEGGALLVLQADVYVTSVTAQKNAIHLTAVNDSTYVNTQGTAPSTGYQRLSISRWNSDAVLVAGANTGVNTDSGWIRCLYILDTVNNTYTVCYSTNNGETFVAVKDELAPANTSRIANFADVTRMGIENDTYNTSSQSYVDNLSVVRVNCIDVDFADGTKTYGEHAWVEADCNNPKTCSTCGKTEGEALGHNISGGICSSCGYVDHVEDNLWTFEADKIASGDLINIYNVSMSSSTVFDERNYIDNSTDRTYSKAAFLSIAENPSDSTDRVLKIVVASLGSAKLSTLTVAPEVADNGGIYVVEFDIMSDSFVNTGRPVVEFWFGDGSANKNVTAMYTKTVSEVLTGYWLGNAKTAEVQPLDPGTWAKTRLVYDLAAGKYYTYYSLDNGTTWIYANTGSASVSNVTEMGIRVNVWNCNGTVYVDDLRAFGDDYVTMQLSDGSAKCFGGHTEVVDEAVAPDCTNTGLTEGKHCSVCNEVLVAQTEVDALGHSWVDANCSAPKTCSVCKATEGEAADHSYVDGVCSVCGDEITSGYMLYIYNGDGTVGMVINGSKSASPFSIKSAIEDARVFADSGFLFGITGTPSFVVEMYEDSTEGASFELGSDVTIKGNGHVIKATADITISGSAKLIDTGINAEGASALTVSGLSFEGNSWINCGTATSLTVSGVTANVTPSNTAYTNSRSAFISLGRSEGQTLALTIENSDIVVPSGTNPVLGWAAITEANIVGNTFGSESVYQNSGDSVKFMSIADGAVLNFTENTVYSNYNGIVLGQNTTRGNSYTAIFEENEFHGSADHIWVEVSGSNTYNGSVNLKSDNTINGNAVSASDIKLLPGLNNFTGYAGVDVVLDASGKVIGGEMQFVADDVIADGYEMDENGNIVETKTYVATVNGVEYETLAEAIAAAQNGETITLLADVADSATINIAGKNITLDLAGHVISGSCNSSQSSLIFIENNAELTVKDSVGEGKITFAQGASNVGWTIDVKGKFVLESGTIELTGSWSIGYAVEVRPNSWGSEYTEPSIFVMNGGSVISSDGAVRVASSSASTHKNVSASFVMNGGYIDAAWDGVFIQQSDAIYDDLSFTINGGTIESDLNPVRVYGPAPTGYVNDNDCISINLVGGTMTYTGTETYEWIIEGILRVGGGSSSATIVENGEVVVSSAIAQSVSAPNGYKWVETTDGDYALAVTAYVAEVNGVGYETLEAAFAAAQAGETITLIDNVTLTESLTIDETVTLDLAGYTVVYNSTTQGEAMITNRGTLTINDTVGTGVINYNYTGAADSSFGKGNFTISNAGTLTVNGGKITIADLRAHAKYPIDNNSTSSDAVLVINGGHLYNYNTSAIRQFCNSTTNKNSVTINGGIVEGYCAIWVQNPGSKTVNGSLTITGGEIKSTASAYVNGTAALEEVSSRIYFTIAGEGGAWSADSFVAITGGTFNENVNLAEEAPATLNVTETSATFNGRIELPMNYVAEVNGTKYESLEAALNAAQAGDTVTLLADVTVSDHITVATGTDVTIDLAGFDITVDDGALNLYIEGKLTMIDSNGDGVSTFRNHYVKANGELIVNGAILQNVATNTGGYAIYNSGTLTINSGVVRSVNTTNYAISAITGSTVTINGGEIYGRGGIAVEGGTLTVNDGKISCTETVHSTSHALWISSGEVTINGGTFEAKKHFNGFAIDVSGGKLVINDGTFIGYHNGETLNNCIYLSGDSTGTVEIKGGNFNYGLEKASDSTGSFVVSGGTFGQSVAEEYCAEGYVALPDLNGNYIVGKKPSATVNDLGASTVPAGDYGIWNGSSFVSGTTVEMPLSFVMQFLADQSAADMADSPYADWYGDFVITFSGIEGGSFVADGCYLAGHYGEFGWVKVPVDGMTIEEGARYPVMLGVGLGQKYDYICSSVQDFRCALYLTPEILAANPNIKVTLELAVVDNSKGSDAAANALVNNENVYSVVDYDYVAEDFVIDDGSVVEIGGTKYMSLEEALEAAISGDVIKLRKDVTVSGIIYITKDITIDINGKTLTADGVVSFAANGKIIDSAESKGLLAVPQGRIMANQNSVGSMLPVWNEDGTGYILVEVTDQAKDVVIVDEDSFSLEFRPGYDISKAERIALFGNGGLNNDISFFIRINFIKDGAVAQYLELQISDELVASVYGNNKSFKITVNGASAAYDSYDVISIVKSNTGLSHSGSVGTFTPAKSSDEE